MIAICYRLWARQLVFFIHLNGTAATDAGLLELKRCKTLTRVSVQSTAVTAAGAKELKAALPNVSVGR